MQKTAMKETASNEIGVSLKLPDAPVFLRSFSAFFA